jgi:hypothetical protein
MYLFAFADSWLRETESIPKPKADAGTSRQALALSIVCCCDTRLAMCWLRLPSALDSFGCSEYSISPPASSICRLSMPGSRHPLLDLHDRQLRSCKQRMNDEGVSGFVPSVFRPKSIMFRVQRDLGPDGSDWRK